MDRPRRTPSRQTRLLGVTVALAVAALLGPEAVEASHAPPRPLVKGHGDEAFAARGSYCWSDLATGESTCATLPFPDQTRRSIRVHRRSRVTVDLRNAAKRLTIRTPGDARYARARRIDPDGRRWSFRARCTGPGSQNVILDAAYDRGTAIFGLRLELHRHARS